MSEDNSQAISFANSYFSLVDGLATGLEDHLASNVVLDWFGRTIRGRANVTAFMKTHKVASRHVFNSIRPVADINYGKSNSTRKINRQRQTVDNYSINKKELNIDSLSISERSDKIDPDNNNVIINLNNELEVGDNENSYELNDDDLANLFALEITPTRRKDIESNINEIKTEEERSSNGKIFRQEIGRRLNGATDYLESTCAVKYVEAGGQIEFSKKSAKRGAEVQAWRRQCKLQIAYSLITSEVRRHLDEQFEEKFDQAMETDDHVSISPGWTVPRLPSLGEITDISDKLVPNINCNFGGYFPANFDFAAERDHFLENFNAELAFKNALASMRTPQYVDDRLVFKGDEINEPPREPISESVVGKPKRENSGGFVFNYLIHLIIYQGNSRCRRSLTQEFNAPIINTESSSTIISAVDN